ncbi:methionine biosynthesis protein MetW [Candidatus Amarolinea aalborgensis]|jgi:methionine biosynthesis protein MetW|uniref:methionine biosynthesis protein MetW n=1 Tax=Candidatus Amarolinea aalborgensis TaxID=2249329 RepID=UPI003BF97216
MAIHLPSLDSLHVGRYAQNPGQEAGSLGEIPALRRDLRAIADFITPGSRVFDIGCGNGDLLAFLKTERQVIGRGLELSESGVLTCVRRGLSVRQGNLEACLPDYPDRAFDYVVLSQTMPFVDDPARTLAEILRVGERGLVSFANWGHWRYRVNLLLTGRMPTAPTDGLPWASPRARALTIRDFQDFCASQGIRVLRAQFLDGQRLLTTAWASNLLATVAVFELARKKD